MEINLEPVQPSSLMPSTKKVHFGCRCMFSESFLRYERNDCKSYIADFEVTFISLLGSNDLRESVDVIEG
jgi:hypothetical protein